MSTIIKSIGISNPQISKTRYHFQAAKVIENPDNNSGKKKTPKHPFSFEHRCARLPDFFPASRFPSPSFPPDVGKGSHSDRERIAERFPFADIGSLIMPTDQQGREGGRRLIASHCTRRIVFAVVYRELLSLSIALPDQMAHLGTENLISVAIRYILLPLPSPPAILSSSLCGCLLNRGATLATSYQFRWRGGGGGNEE